MRDKFNKIAGIPVQVSKFVPKDTMYHLYRGTPDECIMTDSTETVNRALRNHKRKKIIMEHHFPEVWRWWCWLTTRHKLMLRYGDYNLDISGFRCRCGLHWKDTA